MKLVFKSQYTNYLFEDLLFAINAVLPLLKNFINFWSITMDIAKYLKLCILAYINIHTPSALENISVFIRHSFNLTHRFFTALLTRRSSKKLVKQWKKLIFNVNAALFHNYNLINYFRKYINHHLKHWMGKLLCIRSAACFL